MTEKRFHPRLSLRKALTRLVFAAGVLPLFGVALLLFFWLQPLLREQVVLANRGLATALAAQSEQTLLPPHTALRTLATQLDDYLRRGDLQVALDTLVAGSSLYEAVYLADSDDHLAALAVPADKTVRSKDFLGIDLSGSPVIRRVRQQGAARWSEVYRSPISDLSVVAIVVPSGRRLLVAELSLQRLSDFVARLAGSGATLFILDASGRVVAHPDPRLAAQQVNYSQLPILRAADGVASANFSLDGREVIATRVPIQELEWQVLVTQPLAEVQRPFRLIMGSLLALALGGMALALWLGVYFARRVARRFERLADLSTQLAAGNYPEIWPQQDLAEAEVLNHALQDMAGAVREREHAWRELNQTLEERVAERSASLRQAQESLDRSERLAALGSLVAGVAHELNTPIGNALMTATTLRDKTQQFKQRMATGLRRSDLDAFAEDCHHAGDLVTRNLFRASELVSSFKQVAIDQTTSQRRDFDLAALVNEIALTMSPMLRRQHCRLQLDLEAEVMLDSYPGPLGQVLVNLINNAMLHAYPEGGGEIAVAAHRNERGWAEIVVSDSGVGIPAANLKRIFDPFFTTKLGQGGSGLGLHICYNIVTGLLGGEIDVGSTEGFGTRFTLSFPLAAPLAVAVSSPAQAETGGE